MTADTARIAVEDVALVRTNNSLLPNIISRKILFKPIVHSQISERLHLSPIFRNNWMHARWLVQKEDLQSR